MSDYSYSDFISKKIVFSTTIGGKKPLLKQDTRISCSGASKKCASSSKKQCTNASSVALSSKKKISSF